MNEHRMTTDEARTWACRYWSDYIADMAEHGPDWLPDDEGSADAPEKIAAMHWLAARIKTPRVEAPPAPQVKAQAAIRELSETLRCAHCAHPLARMADEAGRPLMACLGCAERLRIMTALPDARLKATA